MRDLNLINWNDKIRLDLIYNTNYQQKRAYNFTRNNPPKVGSTVHGAPCFSPIHYFELANGGNVSGCVVPTANGYWGQNVVTTYGISYSTYNVGYNGQNSKIYVNLPTANDTTNGVIGGHNASQVSDGGYFIPSQKTYLMYTS